jgi:hypothetical protein
MENIKKILRKIAPQPLPRQLVGAALYASEKDELKTSNFEAYCDFVLSCNERTQRRAKVSAAWRRNEFDDSIIWCTGLQFEQICCSVRRAFLALSDAKTADDCVAAHATLKAAADISRTWKVVGDMRRAAPELTTPALDNFAAAALLLAHAHAVGGVSDAKLRAGLWRSVHQTAARLIEVSLPTGDDDDGSNDDSDDDSGDDGDGTYARRFDEVVLERVKLLAEVLALSCSATSHFDQGALGSACACSKHALERVLEHDTFFDKDFIRRLDEEHQRYIFVQKKLGDLNRINFETGLMMPAVALPA